MRAVLRSSSTCILALGVAARSLTVLLCSDVLLTLPKLEFWGQFQARIRKAPSSIGGIPDVRHHVTAGSIDQSMCPAADNVLWDPRYHGSVMMVPVLYCTCVLSIMAGTFVLFVGLRLWQHRVKKQPFRAHAKETQDEEEVGPASSTATPPAFKPARRACLVAAEGKRPGLLINTIQLQV